MPREAPDPVLHPTTQRVLEFVRANPNPSLAEIAAGVRLSNRSVARTHVDRLIAAGLLRERRLANGARAPRMLEAT